MVRCACPRREWGCTDSLALWSSALEQIDCETGEPVDDCRVTPVGAKPFALQLKRTVDLSASNDSELAKTAKQFVDHHRLDSRQTQELVLATTSQASGNVRVVLEAVLDAVRQAADTTDPADLPFNEE